MRPSCLPQSIGANAARVGRVGAPAGLLTARSSGSTRRQDSWHGCRHLVARHSAASQGSDAAPAEAESRRLPHQQHEPEGGPSTSGPQGGASSGTARLPRPGTWGAGGSSTQQRLSSRPQWTPTTPAAPTGTTGSSSSSSSNSSGSAGWLGAWSADSSQGPTMQGAAPAAGTPQQQSPAPSAAPRPAAAEAEARAAARSRRTRGAPSAAAPSRVPGPVRMRGPLAERAEPLGGALGTDSLPDLDSRQITALLRDAPDVQTVGHILDTVPASRLNHIHIAAAYSRLANLHSQRWPMGSEPGMDMLLGVLERLSELAACHVDSMAPRELSTIVWAVSSLDYPLEEPLMAQLVQAFLEAAPQANAVDMSNMAWGIGVQLRQEGQEPMGPGGPGTGTGAGPGTGSWQDGLLDMPSSMSRPLFAAAGSQAGTQGARSTQPPSQQQEAWSELEVGYVAPQVTATATSSATAPHSRQPTHPSATTHQQGQHGRGPAGLPYPPWLQAFVEACLTQLPNMPNRAFVVVTSSLAKLKGAVTPAQAVAMAGMMYARRGVFPPQDLANALCSLARLGQQPPAEWMGTAMAQVAAQLKAFKVDELSLVLYACARLHYVPPKPLLMAVYRFTAYRLTTASMGHLGLLCWSLAELRARPPEEWLDMVVAEALERPQELGPHELSTLMYGLALLGHKPAREAQEQLGLHLFHLLRKGHLSPWQCCNLVCAFGMLRLYTSQRLKRALCAELRLQLPRFTNSALANMLWGLSRLYPNRVPMPLVLAAAREFHDRRHSLNAADLPQGLWALAKLGWRQHWPAPSRLHEMWERAAVLLPEMQPQGLTSLVHATRLLSYCPPERHLEAVMEMLGLRAASMSLRAHRGIGTVVRQLRVMRRDRLREKRQQARVEALLRRRFRLPGSGAAAPVPAAAGPAGVTPVRARRRAAFQAQSLELGSRKGTAIAGRAEGAHGQQEGAQRPARSSGSSKSRRK